MTDIGLSEKAYVVPVRDSQGNITFLRVRAGSLSDARLRATALLGSGQTLAAGPTQVLFEDGSADQEGINSLSQNFPEFANLFANTSASAADIVNQISAFPSGGFAGGAFDPGGEEGTSGVGAGVPLADQQPAGRPEGAAALQQQADLFPFGSFLQAAQERGLGTEGQFGTTVRRQFDPLEATSRLAGIVPGLPTQDTSFQQFFGGNIGRGGEVASEALRNLFAGNLGPSALAGQRQEQLLNPDVLTEQGTQDVSTLRRLARAASAQQFSPFVARNLLPSEARVGRGLSAINAGGGFGQGGQASFQDFLRQQFGLNF